MIAAFSHIAARPLSRPTGAANGAIRRSPMPEPTSAVGGPTRSGGRPPPTPRPRRPPPRRLALCLCRHHPRPDARADDRPPRPAVVAPDARARLPRAGRREHGRGRRLRDPRAAVAAGRCGRARFTSSTCGPSTTAAASAAGCSPGARRELARHGLDRLVVWALADNTVACRFYDGDGRGRVRTRPRTGSAACRSPRSASPGPDRTWIFRRITSADETCGQARPGGGRPAAAPRPGDAVRGSQRKRSCRDRRDDPRHRRGRPPRRGRRLHRGTGRDLRGRASAGDGAHPPGELARRHAEAIREGRRERRQAGEADRRAPPPAPGGRRSARSSIARMSRISRIRVRGPKPRLREAVAVERPRRHAGGAGAPATVARRAGRRGCRRPRRAIRANAPPARTASAGCRTTRRRGRTPSGTPARASSPGRRSQQVGDHLPREPRRRVHPAALVPPGGVARDRDERRGRRRARRCAG